MVTPCYHCARASGHEAECPTGGVYAKADAKTFAPVGLSAGLAMSERQSVFAGKRAGKMQSLRDWCDIDRKDVMSFRRELLCEWPQDTVPEPEEKMLVTVKSFEALRAKAARVDALEAEIKAMREGASKFKLVYKNDAGFLKIVNAEGSGTMKVGAIKAAPDEFARYPISELAEMMRSCSAASRDLACSTCDRIRMSIESRK